MKPTYAFLDVETTGLNDNAKIVELAVILTDNHGNITEEYETLINPEQKIAATRIHGVKSIHVNAAPTMKGILPKLKELLNNKTVVAHYAQYDERHITKATKEAGGNITGTWICTWELSKKHLKADNYKLETLTQDFNKPEGLAHTALYDTKLLKELYFQKLEKHNKTHPQLTINCATTKISEPLTREKAKSLGTPRKPVATNKNMNPTGQPINQIVNLIKTTYQQPPTKNDIRKIELHLDENNHTAGDLLNAIELYVQTSKKLTHLDRHHLEIPPAYLENEQKNELTKIPIGTNVALTGFETEETAFYTTKLNEKGVNVKPGISKTTNLLVSTRTNTKKHQKAQEQGVPTITKKRLNQILATRRQPT